MADDVLSVADDGCVPSEAAAEACHTLVCELCGNSPSEAFWGCSG